MAESKSGSFEESLKRLEEIVKELEGESIDLERSVALFKEGRTLVARCEGLLKNAEDTLKASDGEGAAPPRADDAALEEETPF
jgi:exodeoxyribonuclease VII small subunit